MITNVYQRKDGRFEGRITTSIVDGKRRYKAFFGKNVEEVVEKMTEYRTLSNRSAKNSSDFQTVYAEWFQSISYRVKESTAANYTLKADKHILPRFGAKCIGEITQNSIHQFIKDKQNAGLSNRYSHTDEIGF